MDLGLKNRVAMIAAASKGLGKASALALAQEGCRVSICARTPETLEKTAEELRAYGPVLSLVTDVSSVAGLAACAPVPAAPPVPAESAA